MHPAFAILLLVTSAVLTGDQVASSPDGKLIVSILPANVQKEFDGCGCYFQAGAEENLHPRSLTGWSTGEELHVPLHLNGRTERLTAEIIEISGKPAYRIGDPILFKLANPSIRADLSCKIVRDCENAQGENCEYTGYACDAVIEADGSRVELPANGGCGC